MRALVLFSQALQVILMCVKVGEPLICSAELGLFAVVSQQKEVFLSGTSLPQDVSFWAQGAFTPHQFS